MGHENFIRRTTTSDYVKFDVKLFRLSWFTTGNVKHMQENAFLIVYLLEFPYYIIK